MEKEMINSDINHLLNTVSTAIEDEDSNMSSFIYDNYIRIAEVCKSNYFLNIPLLSLNDILNYEEKGGIRGTYSAIQTSLKQIKSRIEIYIRYNPRTYTKPYFTDIKDSIISEIERASFVIWIAIAWFTDLDIYKALLSAKEQGVNVQILTLNHENNKNRDGSYKLDFRKKIETIYFSGYVVGQENLHHKFCMIDFEMVITGSYNWTISASKNSEDVIFVYDIETAKNYAKKFVDLKKKV